MLRATCRRPFPALAPVPRRRHAPLHTEDVPFADPPPYDAISYCWGTSGATVSLRCNGGALAGTPELVETLEHLHRHRPAPARPPWIDGVCIDQRDAAGKAAQVPRMADVYRGAARVLVWLGPAADASDHALARLPAVARPLADIEWNEYTMDVPLSEAAVAGDAFWRGLRGVLRRAWFERLWTIQEAALGGDDVVVVCGGACAAWSDLAAIVRAAGASPLQGLLFPPAEDSPPMRNELIAVSTVERVKWGLAYWPTYPLHLTLSDGRTKNCTEPVDGVWGFLGLLSAADRRYVIERRWVDYSEAGRREYWRTYARVTA